MSPDATPAQIVAAHPVPWSYVQVGNGVLAMIDARGHEVPLFTVLDFTVGVTQRMVAAAAPKEQQAAAQPG